MDEQDSMSSSDAPECAPHIPSSTHRVMEPTPRASSLMMAPFSSANTTSSEVNGKNFFTSAWAAMDNLFKELSDSEDDELSHSITASVPRFPRRTVSGSLGRPSSTSPTRMSFNTASSSSISNPSLLFQPPSLSSIDSMFSWSKSEERELGHPDCSHRHPFGSLAGDVVLIPGFYGSNLNDKDTDAKGWITMEMVWNLVHASVELPPDFKYGQRDNHVAESIIESVGPINLCRDFIKEMRALELCSGGNMRFHVFPYDWRRELQHSSEEFEAHLTKMYNSNGNKPVTVIAHSMGGLVTLATVNRRPELFKRVVFAGTPFGPVPLIVWALRRGAPLIPNPKLLGTSLHFLCRSAYVFLPRKGNTCLVDDGGNDFDIDFFNVESWRKYCISPLLKRAKTEQERTTLLTYLDYALTSARAFLDSLKHNPSITYPPFTVIRSDRWPTAVGFRSSVVPTSTPSTIDPPYPSRSSSLPTYVPTSLASLHEHSVKLSSSIASLLTPLGKRSSHEELTSVRPPTLNESQKTANAEEPGTRVEIVPDAEGASSANSTAVPVSEPVETAPHAEDLLKQTVSPPLEPVKILSDAEKTSSLKETASPTPHAINSRPIGTVPDAEGGSSSNRTASPIPDPGNWVLDSDGSPHKETLDIPDDEAEPLRGRSTYHHLFDIRLHYPLRFAPGDGVVAASSATMPPGYECNVVATSASHTTMLNDLKALAAALKE
ncbi:hypothetical protein BC829DRAFT_387209 [Chytridium lagenaria]|nr:hypothetical protein BC829DRAFT_387209 [Chytridium lagenaria]